VVFVLIGIGCITAGIWMIKKESAEGEEEASIGYAAEIASADEIESPYILVEEDQELLSKYQDYNPDVVGLIRIDGTVLNHPMVQTPEDESYYLSRDLDGNVNSHGVPFLSADSQIEAKSGNIIVYGHNIHKISRDVFADLAGYEDLDFYKEHPIIETVSKSGTRRWLIFAYFIVDNADDEPFRYADTTRFTSLKSLHEYFQQVEERNWLDVSVPIGIDDTCLTLSSCSLELAGSGTNRMVVMARQLNAAENYQEMVENAKMAEDPLLPTRLSK
jgi:sortase B